MSAGDVIRYTDPNHQPIVPKSGGVLPHCTCGWVGKRFTGPILADHLAEVGSVPTSIHIPTDRNE